MSLKLTIIHWIPLSEQTPEDGKDYFVTDGTTISTAGYFVIQDRSWWSTPSTVDSHDAQFTLPGPVTHFAEIIL